MRARAGLALAALVALLGCDPRLHGQKEPRSEPSGEGAADEEKPDGEGESAAPAAAGAIGMLGALQGAREPGPYEAPRRSPGWRDGAPHAAVLELHGNVVEIDPPFSFSLELLSGGGETLALRKITERLARLSADEAVAAVVLRLGDLSLSMATAEELRATLVAMKKPVHCHAETLGNQAMLLASACETVALAPGGVVELNGPSLVPLYLKGLLDLVGVQADYVHVGAFKGAAEPLTRTSPSPEMKQTYGDIVDGAYRRLVEYVGEGTAAGKAEAWIDTGLFTAESALAAGLIDQIATFEAFRDARAPDGAWRRLKWSEAEGGLNDLMGLLGLRPSRRPSGPRVAVLYAVGEVVQGDGGPGGAFGEIASGKLVPAIRAAAASDDVKAIVVRIDSPGGSPLASELIYQALREAGQKKPVYASLGQVAASGGYYIAVGTTRIFAQPDTLTGSIGVVGGKLVLGGAMAKLGVTAAEFGRGKRALISSPLRPWNSDERATVVALMQDVYKTFKARVAEGRKLDAATVEKHAQGRVFTGAEARTRGLVDELGSLDDAIRAARAAAEIDETVPIDVYPGEPTLLDILGSMSGARASGSIEALCAGPLAALAPILGPRAAASARDVVQLAAGFQREPVRVVAFLPEVR